MSGAIELHISWRRQAEIVSQARVLIEPHGAFNNVIWVPEDCDLIEVNEFPDRNATQTAAVPSVFLAGPWVKGGAGRFWVLESVRKHSAGFYVGKVWVCPRAILAIFARLGQLRAGFNWEVYPLLPHGHWQYPDQSTEMHRTLHSIAGSKGGGGRDESRKQSRQQVSGASY